MGVFDKLKKMASVASSNTNAKPSPQSILIYVSNLIRGFIIVFVVRDHYEVLLCKFAYSEVGRYWKRFGDFLGFYLSKLNGIEQYGLPRLLDVGDIAWSMLDKYRNDKGKDQASIETLRDLLSDVQSSTFKGDTDVTLGICIDY